MEPTLQKRKRFQIFLEKLEWLGHEFILSFSNKSSFFASKRIERALLFISAEAQINIWFYEHRVTLTTTETVEVYTIQMLYAGFMVTQMAKEKKQTAQENLSKDEK